MSNPGKDKPKGYEIVASVEPTTDRWISIGKDEDGESIDRKIKRVTVMPTEKLAKAVQDDLKSLGIESVIRPRTFIGQRPLMAPSKFKMGKTKHPKNHPTLPFGEPNE